VLGGARAIREAGAIKDERGWIGKRSLALATAVAAVLVTAVVSWAHGRERRVLVIERGKLVRGAWQSPAALRSIIARERIKTIVTLTAINRDDPKYVEQAKVATETGVQWRIVPMKGSRATLDQMAEAADLLADPQLQPVFFHCVGGHHRTSLAHAAYLIRHQGASAATAWKAIESLPWTTPFAPADQNDKALIEAFAHHQANKPAADRERRP